MSGARQLHSLLRPTHPAPYTPPCLPACLPAGYLRIAFALYAFSISLHSPRACVLLYFLSFVCDELDGRFARMFGQTSTFGAVLDMVTDRVATSCLVAVLCTLYPSWLLPLLSLLMLDIFSHWFQMYSTLAAGAESHKDVRSRSLVVRFYYSQRLFMGFCCVSVEVLYLCMYCLGFEQFRTWGVMPLPVAVRGLPALAGLPLLPDGAPAVAVLAAAVLPGFAVKQFVNIVQLRTAAGQLVALDQKGRK
jgi:CDP-diacylglycerol--inositol 3-phosphatidyltransferase